MRFPESKPGENWISADAWIQLKERQEEEKLPVGDLGMFSTGAPDTNVVGLVSQHPTNLPAESTEQQEPKIE